MKFRLKNHRWYPIGFFVAASAAASFVLLSPLISSEKRVEVLISVLGVVAGSIHFFYSQHLSQTQFFQSLFADFNQRYDRLNGRLERIRAKCEKNQSFELGDQDIAVLYDYFNLCAEEFLYFDSGFIEPRVWSAWLKGMAHYYKANQIGHLWEADLIANKSYYGFDLKAVRKVAKENDLALRKHASQHDQ